MIIYQNYDKLVQIWGSSPNVVPLKFGVKSTQEDDDKEEEHHDHENFEIESSETPCSSTTPIINNCSEIWSEEDSPPVDTTSDLSTTSISVEENNNENDFIAKTPKRKNNVTKLIDNKRRHLERHLSSAQRDQILLDEAKEDARFRKDLTKAIRENIRKVFQPVSKK
jgi:hypothetical protein